MHCKLLVIIKVIMHRDSFMKIGLGEAWKAHLHFCRNQKMSRTGSKMLFKLN
jgi:hypothetical protein